MAAQASLFERPAMQNRMTSRSRPRQGNTLPAQGTHQERVQSGAPRLPHERDESADSQPSGEPSGKRVGQAAHDDVEQGRVDTDKGPAMDRAYDKLKRS
jgi:hypothetical protein